MIDEGLGPLDEIALKSQFWNTATVNARLRETFRPDAVGHASAMLAGLVGDVPGGDEQAADLATCRLMLAAIRVSGGDLAKLSMWVEAARQDPRDLMAAAEYRSELDEDTAEARENDLLGYLTWVSGRYA